MSQKPILFRVTNNLGIGGIQRRLRSLLPKLLPWYEVHIVTYKAKGIFFNELQKQGVHCHFIPLKGKWDPIGIIKLAKLFKKYNADIVHTHSLGGNISGILAATIAKVPVKIAQVHLSSLHWYAKNKIHRKKQIIEENIVHFLFTNKILFVSKESQNYFLNHTRGLKHKVFLLHNGLELPKNSIPIAPELSKLKKKVVGFVGRIAKGKGLDYFLEFAVEVLKQSDDFVFVIVGPGEVEKWKAKIPKWAKNDILFLGEKKDIYRYYKGLNILLFTSEPKIEGMPGVVLEAACLGIPILARKSEVLREIQEYYPNLKFIDEHVSKAEMLYKTLALKPADTSRIKEHFSIDAMLKRTIQLYQELMGKI